MTFGGCGRQIQYLAGYFQPVDGFVRDGRLEEPNYNIYDQDSALRFIGFKPDVKSSFADNSLTNDDGIRFSSNF
jgi:hypothetical protein